MPESLDDDHTGSAITLEGDEIQDKAGTPIETASFLRLGLSWEEGDAASLELRASKDGATWSEWLRPTIVGEEETSKVGYVDLEGSRFEYRLGSTLPSFVSIEPIAVLETSAGVPGEEIADESAEGEGTIVDGILRRDLAISTPIGAVRIYSRAEWGGRAPRCASGRQTPTRATIHHTVTPTRDSMSPQARLRQIQSFHMNVRGWCDIGYNYLVSRDGRVWRGRGAVTVGAHVANANTGNVGISFMGTHTSTAATATQLCSAARVLARLHQDYRGLALTRTEVKGHRQYGGTACPGGALYNQVDDIVRKARGGCGVK
jgi:hypothetical protein